MIPGVEIGGGETQAPDLNTVNNQLKTPAVQPGQVTNNISNAVNKNNAGTTNYNTIHTTQPWSPQAIDNHMMMAGG